MAHSLRPLSPAALAASLSSSSRPLSPRVVLDVPSINRRAMVLGLSVALWSCDAANVKEAANAAARRPPPPPQEKKDPSLSGVQAKVLASKKRKEAMKASITKLREKGKAVVDEPSSSSSE